MENQIIALASTPTTAEERKAYFRMINDGGEKLSTMINKQIDLVNVYGEMVEITDNETGEAMQAPRVVLSTADGNVYQAISGGILRSVEALIKVYGPAPWADPIPVTVKQRDTKNGHRVLVLDVI